MVRSFLNVSLGRLWWTVGPSAWVATVPALGWVQRATEQAVIAAKSAAVVSAVGVVTALDIGALPGPASAGGPTTDGTALGPTGSQPTGALPSPQPTSEDGDSGSGGTGRDRTDDPDPDPSPSTDPTRSADPSPSPSPSSGGGSTRPVEDAIDEVGETVKGVGETAEDLLGGTLPRLP